LHACNCRSEFASAAPVRIGTRSRLLENKAQMALDLIAEEFQGFTHPCLTVRFRDSCHFMGLSITE
jgi:hypothetical protein